MLKNSLVGLSSDSHGPLCYCDVESKSRESHGAAGESDESISDVIKALKDNNLNFK